MILATAIRTTLKFGLMVSILCLSNFAMAQQSITGGLQGGFSDIRDAAFDDDIAVQVYVGYGVTDWLGFEIAYTDLGSYDLDPEGVISFQDSAVSAGSDIQLDMEAIHVAAVLRGEFYGPLIAEAKVGYYQADFSADFDNVEVANSDDSGMTYQVSLLLQVSRFFDVRLISWQVYNNLQSTDIYTYNVGAGFRIHF